MLVCLQVLMEKIIAIDKKDFRHVHRLLKGFFDSVSQCKLFEAFLEMGFPKSSSRTSKVSVRKPKSRY